MKKELTTLFTGRHYTFLPEIDSTNSYLSGILNNISLPEGATVHALKQRAGRGQKGSVWESEEGKNLLLSILFYPSFIEPKEVFLLNKTYSLGVYDFAKQWLKKNIFIKWPNDIYFGKMKLGGLLIENSINASRITSSILGIGININQKKFSSDLINPISFALIKNREFDLEELFNSLCSCIEHRYLQLKNGAYKKIDEDYHSSLYSLGEWKKFVSNNICFDGNIQGVDENGRLIVQTTESEIKKYDLKEIKYADI